MGTTVSMIAWHAALPGAGVEIRKVVLGSGLVLLGIGAVRPLIRSATDCFRARPAVMIALGRQARTAALRETPR